MVGDRNQEQYYETAMADGNEDNLSAMMPDKLPKGIQELYDKGHK